jgi:hypothetical protein
MPTYNETVYLVSEATVISSDILGAVATVTVGALASCDPSASVTHRMEIAVGGVAHVASEAYKKIKVIFIDGVTNYLCPVDFVEDKGWKNTIGTYVAGIRAKAKNETGYLTPLAGRYDLTYTEGISGGDVPGVDVFTGSGSTGDAVTVEICGYWDGADFQNYGYDPNTLLGHVSTSFRLRIVNETGETLTGCIMYLVNRAVVTQAVFGDPLVSVYQKPGYSPQDTEGSSLPITVVYADGEYQLLVNGLGADMEDEDGNVYYEGRGVLCNNRTAHMFMAGTAYEGITTVIKSSYTGSATMRIYSNIWEMSLDDSVWELNSLELDDILDGGTTDIYLRNYPFSNLTLEDVHGLVLITTSKGDVEIPLRATLVDAQAVDATDNVLFIRCAVISPEIATALREFGVWEAS